MRYISEVRPDQVSLDNLLSFQEEVDALRMDKGWKKSLDKIWATRSASNAFSNIKLCLKEMCHGAIRCCYCEDSAGASIEHIQPKVLYPQMTFSWENFLYVCGKCNSAKKSTWAIFVPNNGNLEFHRIPGKKKGKPHTFPPPGEPVLINPRKENPGSFMQLVIDAKDDKLDFVPITEGKRTTDQTRADFTIKTLQLNSEDRPELAMSRMLAYRDYFDRLSNYARRKHEDHWGKDRLEAIVSRFQKHSHPTVWDEIKRSFEAGKLERVDPDFHQLLKTNSEALTW